MTDARLLATNPENSSLVPVACNAQGQLLVSDVQIEEIPNDVNLDGDLTVTGQAGFGGNLSTTGNAVFGGDLNLAGNVDINGNSIKVGSADQVDISSSGIFLKDTGSASSKNRNVVIDTNGTGVFTSNLQVGSLNSSYFIQNERPSGETVTVGGSEINAIWVKDDKFYINYDGSATFANGKAGFTADGHLWCTTERGDTVWLQGTSQGMGIWAEYTPPTRIEQIKDWSEKDKVDNDFGVSPEDAGET